MMGRIFLALLLFVVFVLALAFAALNPGVVTLNLGWSETTMQKSLALTLCFAAGWFFGVLCLGTVLLKMLLERQRLRRALRLAEAEVNTLRSMPAVHAD